MKEVIVERSLREYAADGALMVSVEPGLMAALQLRAGDLVRVSTMVREILARVDKPIETDRGSRLIRLDRFQRQALRVRLYGRVDIEKAAAVPAVTKLRLQPAVNLSSAASHHLEEHLKEELVGKCSPVTKGTLLFLHFHHSVAGTLYQVVEVQPAAGVVGPATDVVLDNAPDGFGDGVGLDTTFDDLGGLDREIAQLKQLVQLPLQFPGIYRQIGIAPVRGVILYGPPGTGKTLLGRAAANEMDAQFYYINGPDVIGGNYGESEGNLRRIFGEAIHHAPSVVFIDEIDAIAIKRGESGSQADTRLVTQLLSMMDGLDKVEGVVVIGTTNRIESLDVALRRPGRFDYEIYIGAPDATGRAQILDVHTREMPLDAAARDFLHQLAADTPGFVGADLMALCRTAGFMALQRHFPAGLSPTQWQPEQLRVQHADLVAARRKCRPSAARAALSVVADVGFEAVAGLSQIKSQLRSALIEPLRAGQTADGVLLTGPAGVGKTLLAKAVAKEAGSNLLVVNGADLFSKWLGESEEALRHVFRLARDLAPSLVFFDQIDALAPVRGRGHGSWTTERVLHQLLAELDDTRDGSVVGVIAATNRVDLVDDALLQPGRLGTRIVVDLPDAAQRAAILDLYLGDLHVQLHADQRADIASAAAGASGAHLRALAHALRRAGGTPALWPTLIAQWQSQYPPK